MSGAPACSGAPGHRAAPGGAGARQAGWADDRGDAGAGARCRGRRPVPVPPGGQAAPGSARLGGLTTGEMLVRGRVAAGAGLFRGPRGAGARSAVGELDPEPNLSEDRRKPESGGSGLVKGSRYCRFT